MGIDYTWTSGSFAREDGALLEECAKLYSYHYGFWSNKSPHFPGKRVRLSARRLREWLTPEDSRITLARSGPKLVGYAQYRTPSRALHYARHAP